MIETGPYEDLAFIRQTLEDGRRYAQGRSPDILLWGVAIAIGYLATYAFVRRWSPVDPKYVWLACIGLPWLYSLRFLIGHLLGTQATPAHKPLARQAMGALWMGVGLFLTILGLGSDWLGLVGHSAFDVVVAGAMGLAFFASAPLCNLAWMRWVAVCWWGGELLLLRLGGQDGQLLVSAALMFFFLAGPGLFLLLRKS